MRTINRLLVGLVLVSTFFPALGQFNEFDSDSALSPERLQLDFSGLLRETPVADVFSSYGVYFQGSGDTLPRVQELFLVGQRLPLLRNDTLDNLSAGAALRIDFRNPVAQFGFTLRNSAEAATATVTVFDPDGVNLGMTQVNLAATSTAFYGLELAGGGAIGRVTIDYGATETPEEVADLFVTYVDRPDFASCVAQLADGALPTGGLKSIIVITNLANTTAVGSVQIFGNDGAPLAIEINGEVTSEVDFSLNGFSSQSFQTGGTTDPPVEGYACLSANVPVSASAIFQILDAEGQPVSEAGVEATVPRLLARGAALKQTVGAQDSGVAVANTSDQAATGVLLLIDRNGQTVGVNNTFLMLAPGQHVAGFLANLFPNIAGQDFEGTLLITSNVGIVSVILRTGQGLVLSSLPVGSTEP